MKSGSAGELKKKKTHPKHFQLTASHFLLPSPYGCVSLIERVYWCWGEEGQGALRVDCSFAFSCWIKVTFSSKPN